MDRRTFLITSSASVAAMAMPGALWAQNTKTVFRWVPQADLTLLDPMFTTAAITQGHAQLVFDTLYGLDAQYQPHPQMAAGHVVENEGLLWKITLRDGLQFHDGSPVRAQDVIASLNRWAKRDLMGRSLMQATESLSALDDKTVQFTLKQPFPLILNALGRQSGNMACIMPEALANTPDNVAVKQMIGSGPFKFIADQWVSGSRVVYEKFEAYQPRKDDFAPVFTAGPKIAHVDQVRWNIIPDRATAIAALQANEVDGVEMIDSDFLPVLHNDPAIKLVKRSLPTIGVMRFNHLHAPFNNPEIRRAVLSVVNQTDYMTAMNGADFPEYWSDKCGVFVPDSPMASDAGLEKLTGKRDLDKARQQIKDAGYNGETVVLLDPADFPTWHAAALVTADLFKKLGFNVDVQTMDWGTAVQRRNSQEPTSNGGWSVAFTGNTGPNNLDPAGHLAMRGNGKQAWFGWPTSEKLEQLRLDWFNASDLAEQQKICRDIQLQVFEDVPYIPLGATYPVSALRKEWEDFQPQISLFYTVRKT
ncbi:ABC transporter substrate-binding protein [Pollutimonas bauzanensis]|jgi:peptide/nickel transport system substrate-binding protein|uniref:ABC transporter substrate-binding protein n=1 Tax=Pollutimonas bauzanensis TaxID=658167 RepID=UPI00333F05C9